MTDKNFESLQNKILDDVSISDSLNDSNNNIAEKKNINKEINKLELEKLEEEEKYLEIKLLYKKNIEMLRTRLNKDMNNEIKFSLEKYMINIIPIFDNIEYAINSIKQTNLEKFNPIYDQLKIINKLLIKVLNEFNIQVINDVNILFNPDVHQAIAVESSEKIKDNHIIKVLQKGYLLNNRLLRPAMVIVAKN